MPRQVSKPSRGVRLLLSSLVFAAPSVVACSFFAPSLDEYARARGGAGGSAGADSAGNAGAVLAGNGGSTSATGLGGEGGAEAGATGEAGWAGEPMIGQTVTQADTKLDKLITRGLPVFGAFTSYGSD
jgi:hypothetical protein